MKNYEVFIIIAVIAALGWYFYQNTKKTIPATSGGEKVKISSGNSGSNLFPCNAFPCGMISRVVTCCGQVV